jgi:hypothetical protein
VLGSIRMFIASGAAFLLMISLIACGGNSDEVVARVGAGAITKATFEHWLSVTDSTAAQARSHTSPGRLSEQRILGFLISSERTLGEAREADIVVTRSEADAALERIVFERAHGLATPLPEPQNSIFARSKRTADRAWIIEVHLLAEKLAQRRLSQAEDEITHAQIIAYYTTHKDRFVLPERRDVAVIEAFRKTTADAAKREIESGRSLLGVVERRNDEPNVGGFKRGLTRRALRHAYEENYFSARPHALVGPLKAEIYYLFEVTKVSPPRQQRVEEVQSAVRRTLASGTPRQLLRTLAQRLDEKWKGKTRCLAAYMVTQCGSELS